MSAEALLGAFDRQVAWCRPAAPFTARVLQHSRHWLAHDTAALATVAGVAPDPLAAAVPLRWAGALHHLALLRLQPWTSLWPPAAQPASDSALTAAIAAAWHGRRSHMLRALHRPPQTNEVMRSAALLPGLLQVAAATGLPLVLLEIGASAGLNLWCDRYRHDHGVWQWGAVDAALTLRTEWRGPQPAAAQAALHIARRAGCDAHPVDLAQPGEALRLASFVWADQPDRLSRLRTAQALATRWMAQEHVAVQALPAAAFVQRELQAPVAGHATVLMQSVVWQYIAADEQAAIRAALHAAGARASAARPLAWLRLEPQRADAPMELRCQLWPGGADHLLARSQPHAAHVDWLADGSAPGAAA